MDNDYIWIDNMSNLKNPSVSASKEAIQQVNGKVQIKTIRVLNRYGKKAKSSRNCLFMIKSLIQFALVATLNWIRLEER